MYVMSLTTHRAEKESVCDVFDNTQREKESVFDVLDNTQMESVFRKSLYVMSLTTHRGKKSLYLMS